MTDIHELINRRRYQILVHSCIYYRFNENIITDHTYDKWCKELAELQIKYPKESSECMYANEFKDFDGSTGFHLPMHQPNIVSRAQALLTYNRKKR